jgi:hypothetical protein
MLMIGGCWVCDTTFNICVGVDSIKLKDNRHFPFNHYRCLCDGSFSAGFMALAVVFKRAY